MATQRQFPVTLIGGGMNALSLARSLGRKGVEVYSIADAEAETRYSWHCTWLGPSMTGYSQQDWLIFLTSEASYSLQGGMLLATSDDGLELIANNREVLESLYRLDDSNPTAQLQMLDKLATYELAREANIPTPCFWVPASADDLEEVRQDASFPLVIKPLFTHRFQQRFGQKLYVVHSFRELRERFAAIEAAQEKVMLVELIPGRDDQLCSYYTYLDGAGEAMFNFTKRIIRRHPIVYGNGCNHVTDYNPEVQVLALRFFRAVGLRGLANAEFKYDARDRQFKLIECNARFTAANCLLDKAGIDLASFVYDRLAGRRTEIAGNYQAGLRLWYPLEDLACCWMLWCRGELSLREWIGSVRREFVLPRFSLTDPGPTLAYETRRVKRALMNVAERAAGWLGSFRKGAQASRTQVPSSTGVATANQEADCHAQSL